MGATGADVIIGALSDLRSSGGDFSTATQECLDDDSTAMSMLVSDMPTSGDGFWFLVRGQNCGGDGTYDSFPAPVEPRDVEIAASGVDCAGS